MKPGRRPLPPRVRDPARPERPPLPSDPSTLPPLPEAFWSTLREGLAELGLDLDARQLEQLDGFSRLLIAWTGAINLTAIREPEAVAREHLLDSLAAVALLRRLDLGAASLLDVGSGGGLPGIPLAVALPGAHVLLVEIDRQEGTVPRDGRCRDRARPTCGGRERAGGDAR